uniref:Fatty acyl-CoA reductase n=1 Tax=Solanum tuberosum TaxID=4113 RepID=M0ZS89_SOLTU
MLRTTPKINKIYILIRAKDKGAAFNRLKSEIIESKLFKCLEEMHGEYYKPFILNKLIPVVGNIYEPNLGMDIITSQQIAQQIDLIIDSAANTTFDERYDLALDANVNGPYQLMMFAKKCKNLKLLMHYSTAYANGEREGLILEKPFTMGESITKEKITSISSFTNFPSLHVDNEMDLVSKLKNNITNNIGLEQIMKNLGVERVIDPSIFLYGKGELPAVYCDQNTLMDVIPVDLVVNATMAAIAKHGYLQSPQLNVYHLATTFVNPLAIHQIFDYCYEYFTLFPFVNSKGDKIEVKEMKYFDKISDFSNYIWEVLSKQHKVQDLSEKELLKIHMRFKRKVEFLNNFSKRYEPYGFYRGRFHTGNMRILMEEMSEEERKNFEIDASNINWKDYLIGIHISGVRKHVFEGKKLCI